jgi:riboflavin kinase/FMN adenylyltransferase
MTKPVRKTLDALVAFEMPPPARIDLMRIIDATEQPMLAGSAVTIGAFDGVHRGHRQLLSALRRTGINAGLKTVVVTFDPIPRAVISPESAPPLICSLQTRLQLLEQTGDVDYCCVLPFNERMRRATVEDFVAGNLVDRLGMRILVAGENFVCGCGRKGDIAYLTELGKQFSYTVEVQPLHILRGLPRCSSTETRRLIQLGELAKVARLLDRAHEMTGVVLDDVRSEQANVLQAALDENLCTPPKDVYLGAIRMSGRAGHWKEAILKVCDATSLGRAVVHLTFAGGLSARAGDALTIRFTQRAAFDT